MDVYRRSPCCKGQTLVVAVWQTAASNFTFPVHNKNMKMPSVKFTYQNVAIIAFVKYFHYIHTHITFNPYNAEILLYKPWKSKDVFKFEIIIHVSQS